MKLQLIKRLIHMQKLLYLGIGIVILLGCEKNSDFDGDRPDVRLSEKIDGYYQQLSEAPYGWIGYLFPQGGGGYTFKFSFDKKNKVTMYASMNAQLATTPKESSYRIRAAQVPSLYFDTYSYIHLLADPDPRVSGGAAGKGRLSDFEFSIIESSSDTLKLRGNLNGSELLLVRATEAQEDPYMEDVYTYSQQVLAQLERFPTYYNKLSIGGHNLQFMINTALNTVTFRGTNELDSINFYSEYAVSDQGIVLRRPLYMDGQTYAELTDFQIDPVQATASIKIGDKQALVENITAPLVMNTQDANNMYIARYTYFSQSGFTKQGVPDFLQLRNIAGFAGITFVPRRYVDGTDVFYIFYAGGQKYIGPGLRTSVQGNGVIRFHGLLGYDANDAASVTPEIFQKTQTYTQLITSSTGYYVFRTGRNGYDLVNVDDPTLWIRFY